MKKLKFYPLITLIFLLIFSVNIFANIKAVQLSYIKCVNYEELNKEFEKIRKKGFNTVIFRVFNNKGDRVYPFIPVKIPKTKAGVYFQTNYAPVVYNILPTITELCHKNKLKIIAWITTRYLDFGIKNKKRKVLKFDFDKNKIVPSKGLTFFDKNNIRYIANIFSDLLKNNIDGIMLQDDLKILIDEDFNKNAIKYFYNKTGIKLTNKNIKKVLFNNAQKRYLIRKNKNLKIWNNIKSEQIQYFVKKIVSFCKKKKNIDVFMNVNYETLYRPGLSKLWYSYNLETLKKTNINYFVAMLYQKQIKRELHLSEKETYKLLYKIIKNSSNFTYKNRIVYKFQVFDWYTNKNIKKINLNKLFTFLSNHNIHNIALFPYRKNLTFFK